METENTYEKNLQSILRGEKPLRRTRFELYFRDADAKKVLESGKFVVNSDKSFRPAIYGASPVGYCRVAKMFKRVYRAEDHKRAVAIKEKELADARAERERAHAEGERRRARSREVQAQRVFWSERYLPLPIPAGTQQFYVETPTDVEALEKAIAKKKRVKIKAGSNRYFHYSLIKKKTRARFDNETRGAQVAIYLKGKIKIPLFFAKIVKAEPMFDNETRQRVLRYDGVANGIDFVRKCDAGFEMKVVVKDYVKACCGHVMLTLTNIKKLYNGAFDVRKCSLNRKKFKIKG